MTTAPHDLLRITGPSALISNSPVGSCSARPAWVAEQIAMAPWVVVRTARAPSGAVAVGVRGSSRAQRFGCSVHRTSVMQTLHPHQLLSRTGELDPRSPTTRVLADVTEIIDRLLPNATWGPTGAVGYQLATGICTVHSGSDLDLLLQPEGVLDRNGAATLATAFLALDCRVDTQVRTPAGLVALAELASGQMPVLARTIDGPVLVADPWG